MGKKIPRLIGRGDGALQFYFFQTPDAQSIQKVNGIPVGGVILE